MARRNQGINVKVPRAKVIKALETRLVRLEKDYATQGENEAKYERAREKYQKELTDFAIKQIKKAHNFRTNYRAWNNTLNIDFDLTVTQAELPTEPERNFEQIHAHAYKEMKEELENALRILKMCDDELISTATYGSITKYL